MRRLLIIALQALLGLGGILAGCTTASPSVLLGQSSPATSAIAPPSAQAPAAGRPTPTSALATSAPSPSSSAKLVRPDGLIAVDEYQPGDASLFSDSVFSNGLVGGVAPRFNWQDLEPGAGQFAWSILDQVFTQATASHKFVVLILVPGFGTPAWALQGLTTATFARQYGLGAGQAGPLPLPWDQAYLSRWFEFLEAVADRYENNPAFRMVSAAGPTSVSAEMSLPNGSADLTHWTTLGYTSSRYEAAWTTTLAAYERIFPRQFISFALYPGLPIGDDGTSDPSQRTSTPAAIVDEGLRDKAVFALQTSGLTGSKGDTAGYDLVKTNRGSIVTGFQLSTSATRNPGQMGNAADPVDALRLALDRGTAAGVDFLEVYQADVLNPAMQAVLQTTMADLPH